MTKPVSINHATINTHADSVELITVDPLLLT